MNVCSLCSPRSRALTALEDGRRDAANPEGFRGAAAFTHPEINLRPQERSSWQRRSEVELTI